MIFNTFKFAARGVKFQYATKKDSRSLLRELKRLSFMRAVFRKTNGIVAFVFKNNAVLFRLRVPLLHIGKPILYVKISDVNGDTQVNGSFTFAVYARVIFWLVVLFSVGYLGITSFRLFTAIQDSAEPLFYIAVIFRMLIGPLVAYITLTWFHWTWKQCNSDMTDIATGLERASK